MDPTEASPTACLHPLSARLRDEYKQAVPGGAVTVRETCSLCGERVLEVSRGRQILVP